MTLKVNNTIQLDSVECIVPIEAVPAQSQIKLRGPKQQPQKAAEVLKITLSDCVQCSGCITSAEEVFIKESNATKLQEQISSGPCQIIISQPSLNTLKFAITQQYDIDDEIFVEFLQTNLQQEVVIENVNAALQVYSRIAVQQLTQAAQQPMILTDCPAVKMYLFKRAPHLQQYLCNIKTSHEYYKAAFRPGKTHISIQSCNDRKLEALRADVCCYTAADFYSVLQHCSSFFQNQHQLMQEMQKGVNNSYTLFDLKTGLEVLIGHPLEAIQQTRDLQSFNFNGKMFVSLQGFKNLENLCRKKELEPGSVYFVMACPRGCYGGANLVALKDLSEETKAAREYASGHNFLNTDEVFPQEESLVINQMQMTPDQIAASKGVSGVRIQDLQW